MRKILSDYLFLLAYIFAFFFCFVYSLPCYIFDGSEGTCRTYTPDAEGHLSRLLPVLKIKQKGGVRKCGAAEENRVFQNVILWLSW